MNASRTSRTNAAITSGDVSGVVAGGFLYFQNYDEIYSIDIATGEIRWNNEQLGYFPNSNPLVLFGDFVVYVSCYNELSTVRCRLFGYQTSSGQES